MAQFQIQTPDEPTMFAAAQGLGLIASDTVYAPGIVGTLTGGVNAAGAWAANLYGANAAGPGFFGILVLPDSYVLPGDSQTLASRVFLADPSTDVVTATTFVFNGVTIGPIPADSPVVFS